MSNDNIINTTKDKKTLEYMSAKDLQDQNIPAPNIIVQHMIYQGLSVIASPPKLGKSWLSLDLAICVATNPVRVFSMVCSASKRTKII